MFPGTGIVATVGPSWMRLHGRGEDCSDIDLGVVLLRLFLGPLTLFATGVAGLVFFSFFSL
jgi:hypothetical protein